MKLAISNIAWATGDRVAAYHLMREHGVCGLEIAPGLFFSDADDPFSPSEAQAGPRLAEATAAGLSIVSMQSLLFGVSGAALFGDAEARARFVGGMRRAIALAGRFEIPNLVFGSPAQRNIPDSMSPSEARDIGAGVFRELADGAAAAGTRIGIEFNPAAYGTNFLNTHEQAAEFVAAVDHPAVTLILDVGALHMNGDFERIEEIAQAHASRISHVHVSEPYLGPAPARSDQGARVLRAMADAGYQGWYSIEMKATDRGLADVDAALARLVQSLGAAAREGD